MINDTIVWVFLKKKKKKIVISRRLCLISNYKRIKKKKEFDFIDFSETIVKYYDIQSIIWCDQISTVHVNRYFCFINCKKK